MSKIERIIAGITSIRDYNIARDFDDDELLQLLEEKIIKAADISPWRASNMIIDGIIDYRDFPFEKFPPYEQIRQLHYCAIEPSVFLEKADIDFFDADEWLYLLELLPHLADIAPWEMICRDGAPESWAELLEKRPEFEKYTPEKSDIDNKHTLS